MLGMGLRDIGGEAGRMIQRRRSLWSGAEPDGLGGVMPHLIGLAKIFSIRRARISDRTRGFFAPLKRPIFLLHFTNQIGDAAV
jgi:hypothetical protein